MSRRNLLTREELPRMRASCQLAARTLEMVADHIRPGITTDELDRLVDTFIRDHGAYPSPLDYGGFPKSVCTSINEVVCHGIPSDRTLKDGDIINVDVTCTLPEKRGYFGDTSATFYVGEPPPVAMHVTEVARQALEIGIAAVRPGRTFGDIGHAIQTFVESKGCSVVRDFTGHGIGRQFHTPPSVPHYGQPGGGPRIKRGTWAVRDPGEIRGAAVLALGSVGHPTALEPLIALTTGRYENWRRASVALRGRFLDEPRARRVLAWAVRAPDLEQRYLARAALRGASPDAYVLSHEFEAD